MITLIVFGEAYNLQSSPLCSLLQSPSNSSSKYSPQHPVFKHLNLGSFYSVRDHVLHPYKTTDKVIILYILLLTFLDTKREDKSL